MTGIQLSNVSTVIFIVMLASAVYNDIRLHRISNILVMMIMFLGLASQLGTAGSPGIVFWIGGMAAGFGIFLPFYIGGGMGAGDVKLMAAIGGFLGPTVGAVACGTALLAGLPLVIIAVGGRMIRQYAEAASEPTVHATGTYTNTGSFKVLATSKAKRKNKPIPIVTREGNANRIPYAAAIAAGALCGLWWSGSLGQLGVLAA